MIFAEAEPDFSAGVCAAATPDDLHPEAVERFRAMWAESSRNPALAQTSVPQLLEDAELLVDGRVTYAALILLGTRKSVGRHVPQSEIIFEYRSKEAMIASQHRKDYREGFLLFRDDLWDTINLRNDVYTYQVGFVRRTLPSFNEVAVREAILNAVSHREYRYQGSTFVRQWPTCKWCSRQVRPSPSPMGTA